MFMLVYARYCISSKVFCVAGYLEQNNETPTSISLADVVTLTQAMSTNSSF